MRSDIAWALAELSDQFGSARLDDAVVEWIEQGVYDSAVRDRAEKIGAEVGPKNFIQDLHRAFHKDEPVGYEFCSKCDKRLSEFR